ncbi:MAG: 4Fe-4S cluster-binding domain-containing protein [Treponema sp.]|nr:4Fe-4S cluster-binding domain-containing protein [Treponema sp.]
MFIPEEIIFAATDSCNLHCAHCYVNRNPQKLSIEEAKVFLKNCYDFSSHPESPCKILKIGFSGGEPFLYMDFLLQIIPYAVSLDFLFDQIMTNGDWWKDEQDLQTKLQQIYDAGYDGKIGLSFDKFHNQSPERINTFIKCVQNLWGKDSISIQSVVEKGENWWENKKNKKQCRHFNKKLEDKSITQFFLPQSLPSSDNRIWKSKKWFQEDFCQGPGQILYIHPNGKIAPCCGFANENPELFIGTIQDSLDTILKNAQNNPMISLCFEKGLSSLTETPDASYPGKCDDICSFCDWICKDYRLKKSTPI